MANQKAGSSNSSFHDSQLRSIPAQGLEEALILLPDISGFTEFVSNTDVAHSGHIISELLETVIDANELNLEISEIEGDAILFYRFGKVPSPEEIRNQAEKMYKAFHRHLLEYESRRICNCGACSTATNLTLKVIAHAGQLATMSIKGRIKLLGPDIILAHRLLKNDVNSREYLLLSHGWLKVSGSWEEGETSYEDMGRIRYRFRDLGFLKEGLEPAPLPVLEYLRSSKPAGAEMDINAPLDTLYRIVTNLDLRTLWLEGLQDVRTEDEPLQRIGSHHVCVIGGKELDVEAFSLIKPDDDVVEIAERNREAPLFRDVVSLIRMKARESGSKVEMEIHPQNPPLYAKLLGMLGKPVLRRNMKKSLYRLKLLIEQEEIESVGS